MKEIRLRFAMQAEGKILDINEISAENKGLKCSCFCPVCGSPVVAKLGNGARQKHFAHIAQVNCDIEAANQTAIHILAKEIIERRKAIVVPKISVRIQQTGCRNLYHRYWEFEPIVMQEAKEVCFDKVYLEKRVGEIVPDIIASVKGKKLAIEIAVTHFSDKEKIQRFEEINLPAIEVDISGKDRDVGRDVLEQALVEETQNKYWLYNPKRQQLVEEANVIFLKKIEQQRLFEIEEKKKREEELQQREKEMALAYRNRLSKNRNEEKTQGYYKNLIMSKADSKMPFYINVPVQGELIFGCDRRRWQAAIFNKFVYYREAGAIVEESKIWSYLTNREKSIYVDWQLRNQISQRNIADLKTAIIEYLRLLENLGFIKFVERIRGNSIFVVKMRRQLDPPNKVCAERLKKALETMDLYSIDAPKRVKEVLEQIVTAVEKQ